MNNFVQPGDVVTMTAPAGGVVSGQGYLIGALFGVATNTVAEGSEFEMSLAGVVSLAKAAETWVAGDAIYWDDAAAEATTDSAADANVLIGAATVDSASTAALGTVRLNGVAVLAVAAS